MDYCTSLLNNSIVPILIPYCLFLAQQPERSENPQVRSCLSSAPSPELNNKKTSTQKALGNISSRSLSDVISSSLCLCSQQPHRPASSFSCTPCLCTGLCLHLESSLPHICMYTSLKSFQFVFGLSQDKTDWPL